MWSFPVVALCILASAASATADNRCVGSSFTDSVCKEDRDAYGADEDQHTMEVSLLQQDLHISSIKLNHHKGDPLVPPAGAAADAAAAKEKRQAAIAAGEDVGTTTLPPTGMSMNGVGDLAAFLSALFANVATIGVVFLVFSQLRLKYPIVYSNNVLEGFAPSQPDATAYFSWYRASLDLTIDQAEASVGLDQAMLIEFTHLCMKIAAVIGTPMLCIMGPLHYLLGGNAAGEDRLSYLSFGNVEFGSDLYWLHAIVIWAVVVTVVYFIFAAQAKFMPRRHAWLTRMADENPLRSNTVLVEGIPLEYQSDQKLHDFFERVMPVKGEIEAAFMVKDTSVLSAMVLQYEASKEGLHKAAAQWKLDDDDATKKPTVRTSFMGTKVDAISYYTQECERLASSITEEKSKLIAAAKEGTDRKEGNVNCDSGFVTFKSFYITEVSKQLNYTADSKEWVVSTPPAISDLKWGDLMQDPNAKEGRLVIGYALVVGLYLAYMPAVVGITNIAKNIDMGPLQPVWQGLAPTLGLQVMVAFLPTFLLLIYGLFFTLKADSWAQHKLQGWYFAFQIVFVILATAAGQDVNGFTKCIVSDPFALPELLANTMPFATHFYMNFMVLQWATHVMNLLRNASLFKFLGFSKLFDEKEAKAKAEPEDQDYFGLGSRSARWTINMTIGIVFGTLCPPMWLLVFINFALTRLVYGYLIPFAETKKPDLGGAFWVTKLRGLFFSLIIYCVLMIGVLSVRAKTYGPMGIAAPTIVYVMVCFSRFDAKFAWENLPHQQVMEAAERMEGQKAKKAPLSLKNGYQQPVLTYNVK